MGIMLGLMWFAYGLSHHRAARSLEGYRALAFGIAQAYVPALAVFQFNQVANRVNADVARVFGLFQLVHYHAWDAPKPFEPELVIHHWSNWLTPIAYVGLYYVATIPSRQASYRWQTGAVRLEPTGSSRWSSSQEGPPNRVHAPVADGYAGLPNDHGGELGTEPPTPVQHRTKGKKSKQASKHTSLVLGWLSELQVSIGLGLSYLIQVRLPLSLASGDSQS